ncbi:hypothetical protein PHLCEN_2v9759 [Hermanssonia centrifuga]|uniref:Signal peptidase complex subunit 1 n=1 Tax=Hermanssonia centrifuga TaxID=98765 RepID=A0A2R6NPZ5_9APHY|nr:hypothetical protein PHLCEN_2v9759 [Hermanssonia centrifuga]
MDALPESVQRLVEGKIDFEGQKRVDQITRVALVAITIVSFLVGFALQSLRATFGTFGSSTILLILVVVPQWPIYNHHPVTWLPVKEKEAKAK